MRTISDYLNLPYTIQMHPSPEGGYAVSVLELPGCISQGDTREEALRMIEDAMRAWITTAIEDGEDIPEPGEDEYSGRFVLRLPRSLHRQLAILAARERVSLNQYVLYQLARKTGRGPSLRSSRAR